jgi:tetratricopeptide (TPR) repeat protein
MISPSYPSAGQLRLQDFTLLQRHFRREVNRLLPVSASPVFWCRKWGGLMPGGHKQPADDVQSGLDRLIAAEQPGRINGTQVIPLPLEDGEQVAVLLCGLDPDLSEKMAQEWLFELRQDILDNLIRIRNDFIHPETGMYSSRLLQEHIDTAASGPLALFFIAAMHRPGSATAGLMNIAQTARLLEASASAPVFYMGGNIYAVLQETVTRAQALAFARRLLGRLKRQGVRRVHIGIAARNRITTSGEKKSLYGECWQALETAEHRGPFSMCESSILRNREEHPLARPLSRVVRHLQRAWVGRKKFGLLLFRLEGQSSPGDGECSLQQVLRDSVPVKYAVIPFSAAESYVVLPEMSVRQAEVYGKKLKRKIDARLDKIPVALGIGYWPCLDLAKREIPVNCRRALMHGNFFGPGAVTVFDHISLNVSGDYCFDEGDFRGAVKDYQTGLRMDPEDINLMNSLGVAMAELNRHRQAVQLFDRVLHREPENFMALVNKGFALRMLDYRDGAIDCFEKASQQENFVSSPVFSDISLQLGHLYCAAGRYEEALQVLEKLEQFNADKQVFYLYRLLGEAYAETGRDDKGMASLQRAVRHNPHDARSLSTLGELYSRTGQGDDIALSLCAKALAIDDKPWQYWHRLAMVRVNAGDLDGAAAAVRESLRRNGREVDSLLLAGRIYRQQGARNKAKSMYNRVVRQIPDQNEARLALRNMSAKDTGRNEVNHAKSKSDKPD